MQDESTWVKPTCVLLMNLFRLCFRVYVFMYVIHSHPITKHRKFGGIYRINARGLNRHVLSRSLSVVAKLFFVFIFIFISFLRFPFLSNILRLSKSIKFYHQVLTRKENHKRLLTQHTWRWLWDSQNWFCAEQTPCSYLHSLLHRYSRILSLCILQPSQLKPMPIWLWKIFKI